MDVSDVSSVGSAASTARQAPSGAEAQVKLQKKQNEQEGQVAATLIESAGETVEQATPEKGRLIGVA